MSHPVKPQIKSYNTIFSLFTILIRYQDEVYAYSTMLIHAASNWLKLELPNANGLYSILVSIDKAFMGKINGKQ